MSSWCPTARQPDSDSRTFLTLRVGLVSELLPEVWIDSDTVQVLPPCTCPHAAIRTLCRCHAGDGSSSPPPFGRGQNCLLCPRLLAKIRRNGIAQVPEQNARNIHYLNRFCRRVGSLGRLQRGFVDFLSTLSRRDSTNRFGWLLPGYQRCTCSASLSRCRLWLRHRKTAGPRLDVVPFHTEQCSSKRQPPTTSIVWDAKS